MGDLIMDIIARYKARQRVIDEQRSGTVPPVPQGAARDEGAVQAAGAETGVFIEELKDMGNAS